MKLWWVILPTFLLGCSTIATNVETLFADARQPATRVPLYVYRADLQIKTDGVTFDGVGVTGARSVQMNIDVASQINLDRVEVETCARQDVCQNGKPCSNAFNVTPGWFGTAGKHMVYQFLPTADEAKGNCPIYFRVFSKKDLAAWGYLALRAPNEDLPAHMVCNGVTWSFAGHSMCQTKYGLIQRLTFDTPIDDYDVDKECGLTKIDSKTFELRPTLGICTGKFYSQGHWHGIDLIAYDEVLVSGT